MTAPDNSFGSFDHESLEARKRLISAFHAPDAVRPDPVGRTPRARKAKAVATEAPKPDPLAQLPAWTHPTFPQLQALAECDAICVAIYTDPQLFRLLAAQLRAGMVNYAAGFTVAEWWEGGGWIDGLPPTAATLHRRELLDAAGGEEGLAKRYREVFGAEPRTRQRFGKTVQIYAHPELIACLGPSLCTVSLVDHALQRPEFAYLLPYLNQQEP